MSGKRILDALALLKASRNVAVQHFDLRFSQAKSYGQSSSIVKAIRTKGLPILATSVSRFASSQSPSKPSKEGIQQDHFYAASEQNSAAEPAANGDLDVEQAKAERSPLPDGTIPPHNSPIGEEKGDGITYSDVPTGETAQHPVVADAAQNLPLNSSNRPNISGEVLPNTDLSPNEARKAQRQSEDQIPAKTAEPPTWDDIHEFGVEQEQDVFFQPPDTVKPVLSALPRVRVPKTENDVQEGDSHIPPGLNADVYYSGSKRAAEDEPSEEQLSHLFRNPRNARMFGKKGAFAPGGVASRQFHTARTSQGKASETDTESLRQLAGDLAKDVHKANVGIASFQFGDPN